MHLKKNLDTTLPEWIQKIFQLLKKFHFFHYLKLLTVYSSFYVSQIIYLIRYLHKSIKSVGT